MEEAKIAIRVRFKDGSNYTYKVKDVTQAKRYAHSIINTGFRIKRSNTLIYYPVHKIDTVEVEGEGIERGPLNENAHPTETITLVEK